MIQFNTKISELSRVGKATASRLKKLGLEDAKDLIWHLPNRYEDFSQIKPIAEVKVNEAATVCGQVELIANRRSRLKRMNITECLLSDDSGSIKIIWFNQPYLTKQLSSGEQIYLSGRVDDNYYTLQFTNPYWEKASADRIHTGRLIPIYPLTAGLTQKQLRFLIKQVTPLASRLTEYLPPEVLKPHQLISLPTALKQIHWPQNQSSYLEAVKRLKFDELFFIQLLQVKNRQELKAQIAPVINFNENKTKELVSNLPFTLTDDQRKCAWEILKSIAQPSPMNRLLQGDVGSGKTVVAAIACLNCALSGLQAVILAPTEILADQHWQTLQQTLKLFKLTMGILTRSQRQTNHKKTKKISKKEIIEKLSNGQIDIVVGTHALLQEKIDFKKLGLIVVDEQHRFGVEQRHNLKDKTPGDIPHFLSMTATPIPRTLALTLYGDLDISIISQKPPGRQKIITKIVDDANRQAAYKFIKNKIISGQQVFVVCPLIDESDTLGVKAANSEYEKLSKKIFPELKIGLLHGRLKGKDKTEIMDKFRTGRLNILVSTSVIEVGVDIPNATIMMIEGADRFGLAQLHQFRGRVGRSHRQSYCFLFTDNSNPKTLTRLKAMTTSDNGLELAEYDLKLRGAGEIYGTRQSGLPDLKIASLDDLDIIKQAKQAAQNLLKKSPDLTDYPMLKQEFENKKTNFHLE